MAQSILFTKQFHHALKTDLLKTWTLLTAKTRLHTHVNPWKKIPNITLSSEFVKKLDDDFLTLGNVLSIPQKELWDTVTDNRDCIYLVSMFLWFLLKLADHLEELTLEQENAIKTKSTNVIKHNQRKRVIKDCAYMARVCMKVYAVTKIVLREFLELPNDQDLKNVATQLEEAKQLLIYFQPGFHDSFWWKTTNDDAFHSVFSPRIEKQCKFILREDAASSPPEDPEEAEEEEEEEKPKFLNQNDDEDFWYVKFRNLAKPFFGSTKAEEDDEDDEENVGYEKFRDLLEKFAKKKAAKEGNKKEQEKEESMDEEEEQQVVSSSSKTKDNKDEERETLHPEPYMTKEESSLDKSSCVNDLLSCSCMGGAKPKK